VDKHEAAKRRAERERSAGLDPDDDAGRWLDEHDSKPEPPRSKSASKSKLLHQWKQRQRRS
jgi:hypothetical protein